MKNEKKLKEYETVWTCDFCGEEFKTKKESDKHQLVCDKNPDSISFPLNRNIKKSWLVLWITTMIVFGITVYINSNLFSQGLNLFEKKWFLNLFFGNIILGIIGFLGMIFSKNKNKKKVLSVIKYSFVICFYYCLFNIGAVLSVKNTFQEQQQKSDYYRYQIPTLIPTQKNNPTPTVKTKKIVQPTQKAVETDPIIDCVSSYPNCNGSSIKARRSQCLKIYCCGFSDNTWALYTSEEKCNEARNSMKANNPQNNTNYNQEVAKIDCSFNYGVYSYDYGMLTYEECTAKGNAYFDQKRKELGPTPEPGHLERAIQEMYDISHPTYPPIIVPTIDGTIHIEVTPTTGVPYGFSN